MGYDGSWSLDMAVFGGVVEGLQKINEQGESDCRAITDLHHLLKLNNLGVKEPVVRSEQPYRDWSLLIVLVRLDRLP